MTHAELTKKVETFIAELKASKVRFAIFTKNNKRCDISLDCNAKDFIDMIEDFAGRIKQPLASILGAHLISIGLSLLKIHDKDLFDSIKQKISKL